MKANQIIVSYEVLSQYENKKQEEVIYRSKPQHSI